MKQDAVQFITNRLPDEKKIAQDQEAESAGKGTTNSRF
jgi:hypothetical protein